MQKNLLLVVLDGGLLLLLLILVLLLLLLVLLLAVGVVDRGGNAVKVTLAVLGDAATSVRVVLKDTDLLERLADRALDRGRGVLWRRGRGSD